MHINSKQQSCIFFFFFNPPCLSHHIKHSHMTVDMSASVRYFWVFSPQKTLFPVPKLLWLEFDHFWRIWNVWQLEITNKLRIVVSLPTCIQCCLYCPSLLSFYLNTCLCALSTYSVSARSLLNYVCMTLLKFFFLLTATFYLFFNYTCTWFHELSVGAT